MPHPNTLTTTEAALELDCSGETVRRMINSGTLPAHRLAPATKSHWRIYMADIEQLKQHRASWHERFEQPEPQTTV